MQSSGRSRRGKHNRRSLRLTERRAPQHLSNGLGLVCVPIPRRPLFFDLLFDLLVLVLKRSAIYDLRREHLLRNMIRETIPLIKHVHLADNIVESNAVPQRHPVPSLIVQLLILRPRNVDGGRRHAAMPHLRLMLAFVAP